MATSSRLVFAHCDSYGSAGVARGNAAFDASDLVGCWGRCPPRSARARSDRRCVSCGGRGRDAMLD
jgi:hypothetical protein